LSAFALAGAIFESAGFAFAFAVEAFAFVLAFEFGATVFTGAGVEAGVAAGLLAFAFALLAGASPQAIPSALIANAAESTIIFFIL
jgi:hypothetical protein